MKSPAFLFSIHSSKILTVSLFVFGLFCSLSPAVQAGTVSATISIRAVVFPFAAVKAVRAPATLTITEEDVRKGYVKGGPPSLIEVRTNSRRGCVLVLAKGDDPFTGAEVTFEGRTVEVGPRGGMIPLQIAGRRTVSMEYRFLLAHDARPGSYPWPFSLSASPLE